MDTIRNTENTEFDTEKTDLYSSVSNSVPSVLKNIDFTARNLLS